MPRTSYQGPMATLHGVRTCHGYNSANGCSRTMRDALTCGDGVIGGAVYIHACSFWDAAAKKHCLNTSHSLLTGGH